MSISNYYEKYLKYKSKYIHLTQLIGGGKKTAKTYFLANFNDDVKRILINDRDKGFLTFKGDPSLANLDDIFEQIYNKVDVDKDKTIDWIIKSYINNTFGSPSSLEDMGRFKKAISDYAVLNNNQHIHKIKIKIINEIEGLIALEQYIEENEGLFVVIHGKNPDARRLTENGKDDKEIILETEKVIIYKPTTKAGSIYYGFRTNWCTASHENCMFDHYNSQGNLYIIQSKSKDKLKFQLHIESGQLMNYMQKPFTIDEVKSEFKDEKLNLWFEEIWEKEMIEQCAKTKTISIYNTLFKIDSDKLKELFKKVPYKSLTFGDRFDEPLGDLLKGLTSLQSLIFGDSFNQPLRDSLKGLTSLQSLIFGNSFNQPLGDSLKGLTSLQYLDLGNKFNQPLGDSLKGLTSLQTLNLGRNFNQPLGDSLKGLTSLQYLDLGTEFNQPLGDSLNDLTSLQSLTFGDGFNQPLGNSLKGLTSLQSLTFGDGFNQPLGDSLNDLTSLQSLTFGTEFNQPLGDSLKGLTSLQSLHLGWNFNQPLGNSLNGLTSLEYLDLGYVFNQPLGDSLKGLTNLKTVNYKPYP